MTGSSAFADRRLEFLLVAGVILVGLGLRALRPDAMAVEHFDEGVYASNLYCGHLDPPFAYPMRRLYAPPLFPATLEWAQILAGPPAVMWVNVLLGSLTVIAVWWTTRGWFGRSAAIAAAMLAASSEYHIAFSRMALTDVPLSLLMLVGVFAGWRAVVSGRPAWIAAAGVLAGLAWCTKYNGWLALAVTGSGTAAWLVAGALLPRLRPENAPPANRSPRAEGNPTATEDAGSRISNLESEISNPGIGAIILRWGLTAAIAGVIFWMFVLRGLAPFGGYAAVAKNHAGYFVGFGGWWSGLVRQAGAHDLLMGWPTCAGLAAAWFACAWVRSRSGGGRPTGGPWMKIAGLGVLLVVAAQLLTASGLLALGAIVGLASIQRATLKDDHDANQQPTSLAGWMLCAWFIGLLVATPLYYPYPRLSLPWLVACWPLAGAAFAAAVNRLGNQSVEKAAPNSARHPNRAIRLLVISAVAVLVVAPLLFVDIGQVQRGIIDWPRAWQSRSMIQYIGVTTPKVIVSQSAGDSGTNERDVTAVVYVAGDPALFYQLSVATRNLGVVLQPTAGTDSLRAADGAPTFLITRATEGQPRLDAPNLRHLGERAFRPSDLVLLDEHPASAVANRDTVPQTEIRLYEVR